MSKICKIELVLKNGEEVMNVVKNNFSIYRKKYEHSPLYLISKDKEVFEIGYFDDADNCTYKESDITIANILKPFSDEYEKIEDLEQVLDFKWGFYSLIQDMYHLKYK